MAYAVVRTDKLTGTDDRARLVSVRYQPVDSTSNENVATEIENGNSFFSLVLRMALVKFMLVSSRQRALLLQRSSLLLLLK